VPHPLYRGTATRFLKDNRLLPCGFNKTTAAADIAVIGVALDDANFDVNGDRVRYLIDVTSGFGPFGIGVELRFQAIGFRWADNLRPYGAPEPRRFVSFFDSMAAASWVVLARSTTAVR
jgi:hypothetical protein